MAPLPGFGSTDRRPNTRDYVTIPEGTFEIVNRDDVQPTGVSFSQQSFASSDASLTFSEFLADDAERVSAVKNEEARYASNMTLKNVRKKGDAKKEKEDAGNNVHRTGKRKSWNPVKALVNKVSNRKSLPVPKQSDELATGEPWDPRWADVVVSTRIDMKFLCNICRNEHTNKDDCYFGPSGEPETYQQLLREKSKWFTKGVTVCCTVTETEDGRLMLVVEGVNATKEKGVQRAPRPKKGEKKYDPYARFLSLETYQPAVPTNALVRQSTLVTEAEDARANVDSASDNIFGMELEDPFTDKATKVEETPVGTPKLKFRKDNPSFTVPADEGLSSNGTEAPIDEQEAEAKETQSAVVPTTETISSRASEASMAESEAALAVATPVKIQKFKFPKSSLAAAVSGREIVSSKKLEDPFLDKVTNAEDAPAVAVPTGDGVSDNDAEASVSKKMVEATENLAGAESRSEGTSSNEAEDPFTKTVTKTEKTPAAAVLASQFVKEGTLRIDNLSQKMTEDSLKDYFSQFGDVTECTVMRGAATGRSRGRGYLTFIDPECINIVMGKEHCLDGNIIELKRAIHRDPYVVSPLDRTRFFEFKFPEDPFAEEIAKLEETPTAASPMSERALVKIPKLKYRNAAPATGAFANEDVFSTPPQSPIAVLPTNEDARSKEPKNPFATPERDEESEDDKVRTTIHKGSKYSFAMETGSSRKRKRVARVYPIRELTEMDLVFKFPD
jgi:RNA recognition motif-containing protein